jgi:hypothetical protein
VKTTLPTIDLTDAEHAAVTAPLIKRHRYPPFFAIGRK